MFFKKKVAPQIEFPNDADGDALKRLYDDGVDFKKQHNIDFFVVAPDFENGEKIIYIEESRVIDNYDDWNIFQRRRTKPSPLCPFCPL